MTPATTVSTSSARSRISSGSRSRVRVLKPAMSMNTLVTRRRSRAETSRVSSVPHMPQKRMPAGLAVPQAEQITDAPPSPAQQRGRVDERAVAAQAAARVELQDVVARQGSPSEVAEHRALRHGLQRLDDRLTEVDVDGDEVVVVL